MLFFVGYSIDINLSKFGAFIVSEMDGMRDSRGVLIIILNTRMSRTYT